MKTELVCGHKKTMTTNKISFEVQRLGVKSK
jgi:hypothetical protein